MGAEARPKRMTSDIYEVTKSVKMSMPDIGEEKTSSGSFPLITFKILEMYFMIKKIYLVTSRPCKRLIFGGGRIIEITIIKTLVTAIWPAAVVELSIFRKASAFQLSHVRYLHIVLPHIGPNYDRRLDNMLKKSDTLNAIVVVEIYRSSVCKSSKNFISPIKSDEKSSLCRRKFDKCDENLRNCWPY
ncbi:hypothetical protein TcasGA2_TC010261 [Tribolium castaneum]|uniref:Uncharacterized protein n=1 Tax=Tribolium castaneum TaxID=7070 RepID=D7EJS0_TRICA|nr:hypothetical protein TcasGA2_TC010261 [Tribolium castaneum]